MMRSLMFVVVGVLLLASVVHSEHVLRQRTTFVLPGLTREPCPYHFVDARVECYERTAQTKHFYLLVIRSFDGNFMAIILAVVQPDGTFRTQPLPQKLT